MTGTIRVIPAVLTEDPSALARMLKQAATFTDYVQVDIMDGKFVPSRSITANQIQNVPAGLAWEAHLMVEQPEKQLAAFKKAGAKQVIFHFEAAPAPLSVINEAKRLGLKAGLAINPETPVARVKRLTGELDSVLFLSVHPGFYGAQFIPETLDKVRDLRAARPSLRISIDGGIKESNIQHVAESGVDVICVGSGIFLQPDPAEAYRRLTDTANLV